MRVRGRRLARKTLKGKLSLVVAPEETISTVRCAVAAKLDLEVDRIRLRDARDGRRYWNGGGSRGGGRGLPDRHGRAHYGRPGRGPRAPSPSWAIMR